jgi:hypothetical protein
VSENSDETKASNEASFRKTTGLTIKIRAQIDELRAGRRMRVAHGGLLCSRCLENSPAGPNDRYCRPCRAADRRERRAQPKEIEFDGDSEAFARITRGIEGQSP